MDPVAEEWERRALCLRLARTGENLWYQIEPSAKRVNNPSCNGTRNVTNLICTGHAVAWTHAAC